MRDGALPAIALCVMLGLLLGFSGHRARFAAAASLALTAFAVSIFAFPIEWRAPVTIGCWSMTILLAIGVYMGRPVRADLAGCVAALAGALTGALVSELGRPLVLAAALPSMLIAFPAAWLAKRGWPIVVKILASWLLAIALLAGGTTTSTGTSAGSDHLE